MAIRFSLKPASRPQPSTKPLSQPLAKPSTSNKAAPAKLDLRSLARPRDPPASVPGSKLSSQQMSDIRSRFPTFAAMNTAVSVARGEQPGRLDPSLAKLSKEQLAQLDRYSHFAKASNDINPAVAAVAGPLVQGFATAYEYGAKNKTVGDFAAWVTGDKQYKVDDTTSKSNYQNVKAGMEGWWVGIMSKK